MICSESGCRCSRWTFPGRSSEVSKMISQEPATSLLMTIKPLGRA
jgi:hypothetical protein